VHPLSSEKPRGELFAGETFTVEVYGIQAVRSSSVSEIFFKQRLSEKRFLQASSKNIMLALLVCTHREIAQESLKGVWGKLSKESFPQKEEKICDP